MNFISAHSQITQKNEHETKFLWYLRTTRCVKSYLTLNFKVKGQGHNIDTFFEFPNIDLVTIETKHNFSMI